MCLILKVHALSHEFFYSLFHVHWMKSANNLLCEENEFKKLSDCDVCGVF